MTGNGDTGIDPRFLESVKSVLRPICEVRSMLVPEDEISVDDGLVRVCEKSEVIALGEMVLSLAHDLRVILGTWYSDNAACVRMSESLAEAEKNLMAVLDDVRTCILSCNDKL